jgi:endonuclease/exonuclease/phosphatase family metal-dependent hydrolase
VFYRIFAYIRQYIGLALFGFCAFGLSMALLAPHLAPTSALRIVIAFFGLAFPYFFLWQVGFTGLYFRRGEKVLLYISAALCLFSLGQMGGYIQFRFGAAGGEKIRMMSYNVHYFDYLHRRDKSLSRQKNMDIILSEISDAKADIVCLQEFSGATAALTTAAHEYMIGKNGYTYFYRGGGSSLAIYSRYPLQNGETINFEGSHNGAICADAFIDGKKTRIYNLHLQSIKLGSDADKILETNDLKQSQASETKQKYSRVSRKLRHAFAMRSEQAQSITTHLANCPIPILLGGDFNDTPISYTYRLLTRYLSDSFRKGGTGLGSTYAGAIPWLRIDYILADPTFKIHWHSVRQSARASDHYPILVGLSW